MSGKRYNGVDGAAEEDGRAARALVAVLLFAATWTSGASDSESRRAPGPDVIPLDRVVAVTWGPSTPLAGVLGLPTVDEDPHATDWAIQLRLRDGPGVLISRVRSRGARAIGARVRAALPPPDPS